MALNPSVLIFCFAIVSTFFLNVAGAFLLLLCYSLFVALNSKPSFDTSDYLMFALASWLTLAQHWSAVGSIGWFTTWIFMAIPVGFISWRHQFSNAPAIWNTARVFLAVLGCFLAIWGITQVVAFGIPRASGPLADPNTYACLLNLLWFPLCAYFITTENKRIAMLSGAALLIIHMALMMSGSRAAALIWLSLCAGLSVLLWQNITRKRLAFICIMALGNYLIYSIFSSHLMLSSYEAAFDVLQASHPSESPRLLMWESTIRMWLDAPWFGSGLGAWNYLYPIYRMPEETGTAGYYAHNDYLQILQEGGLFTALFFLGVLGWLIARSIKKLAKMPHDAERIENIGIVAGIAAAVFHAFVNFTFYLIYVSTLIGIYLGKLSQPQGASTPLFKQTIALKLAKIVVLVLIAINGFHALLAAGSLSLLREDSIASRVAHAIAPQFSPYSAAVLFASIRPSDTNAQRYITASMANSIINNPSVTIEQAQEIFNEAIAGYALQRKQNRLDAAIPADEASFLIAFDKRFGINAVHLRLARNLLHESVRKNPYRAESAMLLAETYFIEGHPQEAYKILADAALNVWNERDKMLIEAESLRHRFPEHSVKLLSLQQQLREMRVHCWGPECVRNADIGKSARQTLDNLKTSPRLIPENR